MVNTLFASFVALRCRCFVVPSLSLYLELPSGLPLELPSELPLEFLLVLVAVLLALSPRAPHFAFMFWLFVHLSLDSRVR